jgi:selenocysteine-specific elongation factor
LKQIILGTAGHIDHGKTSLIKGGDRRQHRPPQGGAAQRASPSNWALPPSTCPAGSIIGIVDVPGHEKFVKNMVAGATGIDIVVMVIAADEGVMPQTREHMEICSLLGVRTVSWP